MFEEVSMAALGLLLLLAVILLTFSLARLSTLGSAVQRLRERLDLLERTLNQLTADQSRTTPGTLGIPPQATGVSGVLASSQVGAPSAAGSSSMAPPQATGHSGVPPGFQPGAASAPAPSNVTPPLSAPAATPFPPRKPEGSPSRTREEWEAVIGGKLLNRIGALALLIGIGLFLKYAFDNDLISETARVLIGGGAGLACLFGAYRTEKKGYRVFAQGLAGAGIGILYLSGYASFNYYHIVSQPVAFVLLAALTMMSLEIGSRYDSLAVSLLGWLGGILTPLMLGTGESNEPGLFGFLSLLNLGILFVLVRKRTWMGLEVLALAGTYIWYLLWFAEYYTPADLPLTLFFLALFWGFFHAYDLFCALRGAAYLPELRRLVASLHAVTMYGALYALLEADHSPYTGLATVVAALLYGASATLVMLRSPKESGVIAQYTLAAVSLIAIAAAVEFKRFTIIILWAAEACGLYWVGVKRGRRYLRVAGGILFGLTAVTLLALNGSLRFAPTEEFRVLLNIRAAAYCWFAATLAAAAITAGRARDPERPGEAETFHYAWIAILFVLITVETNDLFAFWKSGVNGFEKTYLDFSLLMVLSAVWSMYSLALSAVTRLNMTRSLLFSGMWLVLGAGCLAGLRGLSFDPLSFYTPVTNIRLGVIVFSVLALVMHVYLSRRYSYRSDWIPEIAGVMSILAVSLLLVLLTSEVRDCFQKLILEIGTGGESSTARAEVTRLENLEQLSLSGAWLFFSIGLMVWGIWKRTRNLRIMSIFLFGIAILKIFIYDLSFLETLYRIGSFIGLGVILLSVSYLYQRFKAVILEPGEGSAPRP
jgi:uncharacterized membrane protein